MLPRVSVPRQTHKYSVFIKDPSQQRDTNSQITLRIQTGLDLYFFFGVIVGQRKEGM